MKMLASLVLVGIVLFGIGAGTWAYFDDTETSSGNYLTTTIMDLQLSLDGSTWYDTVPDDWKNVFMGTVYPGWDSGMQSLYVKNEGELSGTLYLWVNWSLDEGVNPESETNGGQTLEDVIHVEVWYGGELKFNDTLSNWHHKGFDTKLELGSLPGGTSEEIKVHAWIPYDEAGNDIQGDEITFNFGLYLKQNEP
ncbi:SipW-dependent-type signal peptide-containing protein [Thermococcus sp. ES12]|uniref:SipW-dependent-type signal peptide-containing protein n=1 Tax=Thermococcus sp. ES12 TaxID=1638246 RepID=UPI00143143B7|nr:SipW-dependent-type signal peptide-containing protein [Thermococcus sp. ES12]